MSINKKSYSTIDKHKKEGKVLKPPLTQIPDLKPESWIDSRLPEMLWASLILSKLHREDALDVLRHFLDYCYQLPEDKRPTDMTLTAFAKLPQSSLNSILDILCLEDCVKEALLPLLLIDSLPGREVWSEIIGEEPDSTGWTILGSAVTNTIDHQSQMSTDCRWIRVIYLVLQGRFHCQSKEMVREFLEYPNYGDMRKVRPTIRSCELAISSMMADHSTDWPESFWSECMMKTECIGRGDNAELSTSNNRSIMERINQLYDSLVLHCNFTRRTTMVDERHDTVFGMAFYCLQIVSELLLPGNSINILGRMALRALVDCYISLAYLAKNDKDEQWQAYRNYGSGQAKLAFIKLDNMANTPTYVNKDLLEALATEDRWLEFQDIPLGHWGNTDLRKMSEIADVKEEYDRYYSWTSGFIHANWAAVRNSVFTTCWNPLHRLHRIPDGWHTHDNVLDEACIVVDKVLEIVDSHYPGFPHRIRTISEE